MKKDGPLMWLPPGWLDPDSAASNLERPTRFDELVVWV